jgi:O-antigen/teichoic acid export membrane protein
MNESKTERLSIEQNMLWNSAGSLIYMICQWLITVMVVRISNVTVAGDLTLAISLNNIFNSFALFGIKSYQVSDIRAKYDDGTYINSRFITCGIAFLSCVAYAFLIPYTGEQKLSIILYCLFKTGEALYDVYSGICQKNMRMDYIGKSWLMKGILTLVSFCSGLYLTQSLPIAITCMATVSYFVFFLYDIRVTSRLSDLHFQGKTKQALVLMKECLPLLVYSFLTTTISSIPRLVLERIAGSYALGIYGSVSAPTVVVQMGASYIFSPLMTPIAECYANKDSDRFHSILRKCFVAIGVIGVIALAGGKVLGYWGLNLIYGKEVANHEDLLLPLIGCTLATAFIWALGGILTVFRDFRGLIVANVIALLYSIPSSYLFIKKWGSMGACIAYGTALILQVIIMLVILHLDEKIFAGRGEKHE